MGSASTTGCATPWGTLRAGSEKTADYIEDAQHLVEGPVVGGVFPGWGCPFTHTCFVTPDAVR